MTISDKTILVTGGGGFIGSHLVEDLLSDGADVRVVDDFSNGSRESLSEQVTLIEGSLMDADTLNRAITSELDLVFHLAAHKSVKTDSPRTDCITNLDMTYRVLERMYEVGVTEMAFTSSSTVYGEAGTPTPEDHTPLEPISAYGVSKLACEGALSVYAHSHDFTVWNFRFANIVGPRLRGAVIPDFIEKLSDDGSRLEILGNGRQEKSYMHISDCINAMRHLIRSEDDAVNTFNLGTDSTTTVTKIAEIVAEEMDLEPEFEYTGGRKGWTGDVPRMQLSIQKLKSNGFEPTWTSDEAIRRATRELLEEDLSS